MKADPLERGDWLGVEVNISGENGVPGTGGEDPGSKMSCRHHPGDSGSSVMWGG